MVRSKGSDLTNDNWAKRNWNECKKCCFRDQEKTIQHLFIFRPFTALIWHTVYVAYNLPPSTSIPKLFGNWLVGISKKLKGHIRVGVCALLRAIWIYRNDNIFNRSCYINFLQVTFRPISSICVWSPLQREDAEDLMAFGCKRVEMVLQALFNQFVFLKQTPFLIKNNGYIVY